MSYKVSEEDDGFYIIENNELKITRYSSRDKAEQTCRKLNLGSGFQGKTPAFFSYENNNVVYDYTEDSEYVWEE